MSGPVNLLKAFERVEERWQPRVIAAINDYRVKIARIEGEFVWHDHPDTDEAFFVVEGEIRIDLPGRSVHLGEGELFVVPRGVRHRPVAVKEAKILLIEPAGVVNTGDAGGDRTTDTDVWL